MSYGSGNGQRSSLQQDSIMMHGVCALTVSKEIPRPCPNKISIAGWTEINHSCWQVKLLRLIGLPSAAESIKKQSDEAYISKINKLREGPACPSAALCYNPLSLQHLHSFSPSLLSLHRYSCLFMRSTPPTSRPPQGKLQ